MRVGSLVECVETIGELPFGISCNRPQPVKGDVEVVSDIDGEAISLEGFFFANLPSCITAVRFQAKYFREVQPPMDLAFINELQKEAVC